MLHHVIETAVALQRYLASDARGAADLGRQAEEYALTMHDCTPGHAEEYFSGRMKPDDIDTEILIGMGAWLAFVRHGLVLRGYLAEPVDTP
jgi:hypothetical protein